MTESGIILWNLHHYQRKMESLKLEFRELFIFTCFYKCVSLEALNRGGALVFSVWFLFARFQKTHWECGSHSQAERQAYIEIYTDMYERNHKYIEFAHRSPFWGPMSHAGHHAASAGGEGGVLTKFQLSLQINWLSVRISLLTEGAFCLFGVFLFFFGDNLVMNCIFSQCKDCWLLSRQSNSVLKGLCQR